MAATSLRAEFAPANPIARRELFAAAVGVDALALPAIASAAVDLDTGDDAYPDFWACLVRDVKVMAS